MSGDKQLKLFEKENGNVIRDDKTKEIKRVVDSRYNEEYCFNQLRTANDVWDMRAWDKYKDKDEIFEWLREIEKHEGSAKNCGHVRYCIRLLMDYGKSLGDIAKALLDNPNVMYKNRKAKCFFNGKNCPEWTEEKGFSGCNCKECE